MNYPLISEYIEAIKTSEENFEQLNQLRPVLDEDGEPVMTSGNFAVVFKMKNEQTGKLHAVKCFLKEQEGRAEAYRMIAEELEYVNSTFLTPIKYLDRELFVDSKNSDETEFPVLLMDWVEGKTLDKYIREHIDDQYELSLLAYQFSRLAMWLMPQPFAHGDLKPDNILVKEDGTLVLVDYDGMYVPAMKGQKARELGSPDFRHPSRTEEVFDDHIDDFSLASILLSLKAIALQPSLLEEYGATDRLLFSEKDYRNLSESSALGALQPLMQDAELASLYSLYILALSQHNLSQVSFRLFNLSRPDKLLYVVENLSTEVTEDDLVNAWTDDYGVKYSADRVRLLKGANIEDYTIIEGVKVICDGAFFDCDYLDSLIIPNSVSLIGEYAFCNCGLYKIIIPDSITCISPGTFSGCTWLHEVIISDNIKSIGNSAFADCESLRTVKLPNNIKTIENYTFENSGIEEIVIPNGVTTIGKAAFKGRSLKAITMPESVINIGEAAFKGSSLKAITIPESVISIGEEAFAFCTLLETINLSKNITSLDDALFIGCESLISISLPYGIKTIGDYVFKSCKYLRSVYMPGSIMEIGYGVFDYTQTAIFVPKGEKDRIIDLLPDEERVLLCGAFVEI